MVAHLTFFAFGLAVKREQRECSFLVLRWEIYGYFAELGGHSADRASVLVGN